MKYVLKLKSTLLAALMLIALVCIPVGVAALDPFANACNSSTASQQTALCKDRGGQQLFGVGSIWNNLINLLLVLIGLISVIMIIIGAIRYVTSNGEQKAIADAKNVILYA